MKSSRVTRAIPGSLVLWASFLLASIGGADVPSAEGLWWADGGSAQVDVRDRGGELVGTIVWLRDPLGPDGRPLRDENHPEAANRDRPVIGLAMLRGFRADSEAPGTWHGGSIYDPANGGTYRGTIRMDGQDRLLLRGFIGISLFGRTTTWIRVGREEPGSAEPVCEGGGREDAASHGASGQSSPHGTGT